MSVESTDFRKPTRQEQALLKFLVEASSAVDLPMGWLELLMVQEMSDGGMGSLRLRMPGASPERAFGRMAADCRFADVDNVEVIASLNVDQYGGLLELDMWKTDFSRVVRIPEKFRNTGE